MPTYADVVGAAERIAEGIVRTPAAESRTLSQLTGASVVLKFENLQFTGSFKDRGALNKLLTVDAPGVVAMSAGNHAQGVAYHGGRLGIPTTIVMPESAPFVKVAHTRDLGATVLTVGRTVDEAGERAREIADTEGLALIHPFDDPVVIAGQGTVALELVHDFADLDVIVVPVGGGGLASGIALVAAEHGIEVVGVQTERYTGMVDLLRGQTDTAHPGSTIADGIAVKSPGTLTSAILRELDVDMLTVAESSIERAVAQLLEIEKTVVEGAGAVPLAALFDHPERFDGRRVGLILSGGNIDPRTLAIVTLRGLGNQGRLVRLKAELDDQPGNLAAIATAISDLGANVVEVEHERMGSVGARSTVVEFLLDTLDEDHATRIVNALNDQRFSVTRLDW